MDINTIKLMRDGLCGKDSKREQPPAKKSDKREITRGCLKMIDYMFF